MVFHKLLIQQIKLFSKLNFKGYYYSVVSQIADHLTVGIDININNKSKKPLKEKITFRKYNQDNMAKVSSELNDINWNRMFNMSLDEMVEFLTNTINDSINKHIPSITINKTKKMDNVWFTKGLQKSKLKLRKLEKKYKQKPNLLNKTTLDEYSKQYKSLIRKIKNNYYRNKLLNSWGDGRKQWNIINEICGRISKDTNCINTLQIGNVKTADKLKITNAFCKYFSTIGETISNKYPTNNEYIKQLENIKPKTEFEFKMSSIAKTKSFIKSLKNKSSSGNDEISNKTLKSLLNEISRPLTYIINKSLETNTYPTTWKISKCFPLYKKGDKTEVNNYRPISLQNCMSKILEKTVKSQMVEYLEHNELLPNNQFGFRNKQGLNHLHFKLNQEITKSLSKKQVYKIALLDFSKAFDLVNHKILLTKLKSLGFKDGTIAWFKSYLSERLMYCKVNNIDSDLMQVLCGVPQGTCLGPLLFLCYTYDITYITKDYLTFADDTSISATGSDEVTTAKNLKKL